MKGTKKMQDHVNYSKFSIFYFELLKNWCYKMTKRLAGSALITPAMNSFYFLFVN